MAAARAMASSSRNRHLPAVEQGTSNYVLDLERAKYWVSKGAKPSDTVASFIKKSRVRRSRRQRRSGSAHRHRFNIRRPCKPFWNTSSKGW